MTFLEFFAGGGLARVGLGERWACTFANDIDRRKCAAYADNFGRQGLVIGDIAHLKLSDLPGVATLAWASPPCQDVSLAGDRAGLDGARSGAFWPFWRLMQALRAEGRAPRLIVIENVCGLLTSHGGKDFDAICRALTDAGYVFGPLTIDAGHFVPQSRERVFILAAAGNAARPGLAVPAAIVADKPSLPFHPPSLVAACKRQQDPIWWRLPVPPARNTVLADLIDDEPQGVRWNDQAYTDQLIAMMSAANSAKLEAAKRAGKRMVGGLYRRSRGNRDAGTHVSRWEVRFDDIAGCLRMPTGGSSIQTIVIVDGGIVRTRRLSAREAARLMGASEDYRLPDNYLEAYGLMADGVVAPVVRHLAARIFGTSVGSKPMSLIRCHVCHADPIGRWVQPAACIFVDRHQQSGGSRYRCREHVSPQKEEELQRRERGYGFPMR